MTKDSGPRLYILSAGRTGTVFLEKLFDEYAPQVTAEHEPKPTREQMMMANMRNDCGIGSGLLKRWFNTARARREARHEGPYIEINPLLCAMTDLLSDPLRPMRVVHITREPAGWARSMSTFKASRKFRWFIDYVPFAKPYPSPRPQGWRRWSYYERNLARWTWCNTRIMAVKHEATAYTHLRYEDLFSQELSIREATVMQIFDTLDLQRPASIDWGLFNTRVNPAPLSSTAYNESAAARLCGALARELGYEN